MVEVCTPQNLCKESVGLGKCYYVSGPTACRGKVCALIPHENYEQVTLRYIYYYLLLNREKTNKLAHFTTNLGVIRRTELAELKIPIPPREHQKQIVDYLNLIYEQQIPSLKNEKFNNYVAGSDKFLKLAGPTQTFKLGDICNIRHGTRIVKKNLSGGLTPVVWRW